MDLFKSDEKIMDMTEGYVDRVDGKLSCGDFYKCDKPSFYDLLWRDFCMQNNIKSKVEWTTL